MRLSKYTGPRGRNERRNIMKTLSTIMAALVLCTALMSTAHAYAKGTRVYAVAGKGSAAHVVTGYVNYQGSTSSKVDWKDCYNCTAWNSNSALTTSWSVANDHKKRMRRKSLVRKVGTAAAIGVAYTFSGRH